MAKRKPANQPTAQDGIGEFSPYIRPHSSELPEMAKESPIDAAMLAAQYVIDGVEFLQYSLTDPEPLEDAIIRRSWLLDVEVAMLDEFLTDEVFDALNSQHHLAVQVGDIFATSYAEVALNIGLDWLRTLGLESGLTWQIAMNWPRPRGVRHGIDGRSVFDNWLQVCEARKRKPFIVCDELRINIRKECSRASGKPMVRQREPKCRLRVESDLSGDFVWLDETRYPVSEKVADTLKDAIHARDWVSSECKTRDIRALPAELQSLIERVSGKGTRLLRCAWLS